MVIVLHHKSQLFFQLLRTPQVIRVKKSDPSSPCSAQSIVTGYCSPRVLWIAFIFDSSVRFHKRLYHLKCIVFRAVILYEQLPILVCLRLNTLYRLCYKISTRPSGSDNRYQSVVLHNKNLRLNIKGYNMLPSEHPGPYRMS